MASKKIVTSKERPVIGYVGLWESAKFFLELGKKHERVLKDL